MQIADALETAYGAGIGHRNITPANRVITKSGAELLDFGLPRTGVRDWMTAINRR